MEKWESLPSEVNDVVSCLESYNGRLIAGGLFTKAGQASLNRIAAWDSAGWVKLGNGLTGGYNPFAYKSIVFNNELYVVGNFDSAGEVVCHDIAKWNDTSWSGLGLGTNINSAIFSIIVYHNEIYVGGTFDSIGGMPASKIAKWNGLEWTALESGLRGNSVIDLCVYQDELYVLGAFDTVAGLACKNIARWNGIKWDSVGAGIKSGNVMLEWRGKLLVASQNQLINMELLREIKQWDNQEWTLFNQQNIFPMQELIVYKNRLWGAGGVTGALPRKYSNIAVWDEDSSKWDIVGSGINNYVSALCIHNKQLYCGGYFNKEDSADHNFIAKLINDNSSVVLTAKEPQITVYPNPTNGYFVIQFENYKSGHLELGSVSGQNILTKEFQDVKYLTVNMREDIKGNIIILKIVLSDGTTLSRFVSID